MLKKLATMIVAGCFVVASAGMAAAATTTYNVQMCGASAQAGFWNKAGDAVMQTAFNCGAADIAEYGGTAGDTYVVRGTGCEVDSDGANDDIVYMQYKSVSSSHGCTNYNCVETTGWADAANCDYVNGTCTQLGGDTTPTPLPCMMGCADVACDTITATTTGFYHGRSGFGSEAFLGYGNAAGYPITTTDTWQGVIVPFGFIVNNGVVHNVCTAPETEALPAGAHLAYDKEYWQCDPSKNGVEWVYDETTGWSEESTTEPLANMECRGNYKCLSGFCQDGNQDDAQLQKACSVPSDCPMDIELTKCEERPLKNISRLMVLHIFSDQVYNWKDFGPSFPSIPIVKCMRHGGSGTHQTLVNTVFRGDATLATATVPTPVRQFTNQSYVWHYKSSSDLTKDCVAFYEGAIGYVDADKVMFRSGIAGNGLGVHQLMYQGVEPGRMAVAGGKYNFWAAQYCFTDSNQGCVGSDEMMVMNQLMATAANPVNLEYPIFGERAYFWATGGEMTVDKATEYAYPNKIAVTPWPY